MDEKKLDLKITLDAKNDVLYCSFGSEREAYSVEVEDGVFLRLDPETDNPVGMTVVDFCKKMAEHPGRTVSLPFWPDMALKYAI
jgi:Protein of unknown function (DUF2283)